MVSYSKIEQETIVLLTICEMIDDMVNHAIFKASNSLTDGNILFHTHIHSQLFNILLVDFLSYPKRSHDTKKLPFNLPPVDTNGAPSDRSYLFYLKRIHADPSFGKVPNLLQKSLCNLTEWLDGDVVLEDTYFSNLGLTLTVKINRAQALSMTGNIGKHNFTRLTDIAKKLQNIFTTHGHELTLDECYATLPEFQDHFHDHAFHYQSSHIIQMLNDVRWGIHEYLLPQYEQSFEQMTSQQGRQLGWQYDIPISIENEFAKGSYRLLMDLVRQQPVVQRFEVNKSMKNLLR